MAIYKAKFGSDNWFYVHTIKAAKDDNDALLIALKKLCELKKGNTRLQFPMETYLKSIYKGTKLVWKA